MIPTNRLKNLEKSSYIHTGEPWDMLKKISPYNNLLGDAHSSIYSGTLIKSPTLNIKIEDDYYNLPFELEGLAAFVQSSKAILTLEENWDDNGALRIDKQTWITACKAIIEYSKDILSNHMIAIPLPDMNPCPDGSIDLVWRKPNLRLLINIKPPSSKIAASGYGDLMDNEQPIKIVIPKNKPLVIDHVSYWMKNIC